MGHAVAINTNNFVAQRSTMALANEGTNLGMFFYLKIFQRMFIVFPAAYVTNLEYGRRCNMERSTSFE